MARVVRQEETPVVRDLPQCALRDQVARMLDDRGVAVVEADRGHHTRTIGRRGDLCRLGGGGPPGALPPQRVAPRGPRGGPPPGGGVGGGGGAGGAAGG